MTPKTRQWWLSIVGGLVYLAALGLAAHWGVTEALRTLPESAGGPVSVPIGIVLTIDGNGEPIHLAGQVQDLRDYYFAHRTAEARREGDAEARGLRRVFEPIEVRTLGRDADAVEVEVVAGPLAGVKSWVHVSQVAPTPARATSPAK